MIKELICEKNNTLIQALQVINDNAKGSVFITDAEGKLCGILTDGDIRRFILEGKNLQSKVSEALHSNFIYAEVGDSLESMMSKISDKIKIIPIVDDNFQVVDFFEEKNRLHLPIASPDLKGNEFKYLIDAFLSTRISNSGEYVERFENSFAEFCQCTQGVAVSNGTVALHLSLVALGVGKLDEVIVPDLTFAATINAVLHAGATPVIVDVEKDSWCIDPNEIKKAITPKTKAIIPVHLYGQPCGMDAIMAIAKDNNLFVIEDCAEAHGARYDDNRVGSFGDVGCFSFYGNKVITTGEGGMVVTNSLELADKMRVLRDHGMSKTKRYWHDMVGYNYRMTNLQASIGVAQLERIDDILKERRSIEDDYKKYLAEIDIIKFQRNDLPLREKITWLVSLLIENGRRDFYMDRFKENGIDVRNFFYPLSTMDIYKDFVFSNKNSLEISKQGVSFPTVYNNSKFYKHIFKHIKKILKD